MKFKVGDEVKTKVGNGMVVFVKKNGAPYLVKIEGFNGHTGSSGIPYGWKNQDGKTDKRWFEEKELELIKSIKNSSYPRIITNKPATIILWENGDKTVVKCQKGDKYNKMFGIALATLKYSFGNDSKASLKAYELLKQLKVEEKPFSLSKENIEKFANDEIRIFVTKQEEYDELMNYLEGLGFVWRDTLDKPTNKNYFRENGVIEIASLTKKTIAFERYTSNKSIAFSEFKGE